MAIKQATILPHSPLLIPEIGQLNHGFLKKTSAAYHLVGQELGLNKIDTVIIISPHGPVQKDIFTINIAPQMNLSLPEFGFMTGESIAGDLPLALNLVQEIEAAEMNDGEEPFKIQQISQALDYGAAIPLLLLKREQPNIKTIVINYAKLDPEKFFRLGIILGQILEKSPHNIALIASADLSHRLKKNSPGGYSPKGAKFDNKLIENLSDPAKARESILSLDANLVKDAGECGLKAIAMLLGIIGKSYEPEVLAYQNDFGIGYLSFKFHLQN